MGIHDSQCVHEDGSTPTFPDGIRTLEHGAETRALRLDACHLTPSGRTLREPSGPDYAGVWGAPLRHRREKWEHKVAQGMGHVSTCQWLVTLRMQVALVTEVSIVATTVEVVLFKWSRFNYRIKQLNYCTRSKLSLSVNKWMPENPAVSPRSGGTRQPEPRPEAGWSWTSARAS
jgi:hypothetical protein